MSENLTDNKRLGENAPPVLPNWTVAHAFGEIVWLMTRSDGYKHYTMSDLEWLLMPALLLQQFRIFHTGAVPAGALLWASLDEATGERMLDPKFRLRPDLWRVGDDIWITDIVMPAGSSPLAAAGMVEDFKLKVFPETLVRLRQLDLKTRQLSVLKLGEVKTTH